ncbi:hypothetical protein ACN6K4_003330 [Streptomyces hayashii]|uniref:hypothetical protein n=1 Tax=Streptomyces hayashii TaxID=2839966 RepID=UPI00403C914A
MNRKKLKDMATPEQQWAAQQAPRLRQLAHSAEQESERRQMTADVYGREGRDYTDPRKAAEAQREADRLARHARGLRATATQAEAQVAPKPKRRWFR